MGLFRLLLALSVVLAHAGPLFGVRGLTGALAVQTFFVVSGFYMAMVLTTRYNRPQDYWLFLSNRFLRLFPTYWLIAGLTLLLLLAWGQWCAGCDAGDAAAHFRYDFFAPYRELSAGFGALLGTLNASLIGQDVTLFLHAIPETGSLAFTPSFRSTENPGYLYMLVPQAWTLSLEIMFYIMAPALNRLSTRSLVLIVLGSFVVRVAIYYGLHLHRDPWTYRFFPAEIGLFLLGMLTYRWHAWIGARASKALTRAIFAILILTVAAYMLHPYGERLHWCFILLTAVALPFAFRATGRSTLDRWIGELSYPVYISHFLVLLIISPLVRLWQLQPLQSGAIVLFTLLTSAAIHRLLVEPIEKLRAARYTQPGIANAAA